MDTKSFAWAAELSAANRCCLVLAFALACFGCKSNPTNPFLADHKKDEHHHEEPAETETAAQAVNELREEIESAASGTAQAVRQTAAQITDDGRAIGTQAVVAAHAVALDAAHTAQLQAIDALAALPIDEAGPILLLTIAEGTDVARRAAARQLAERWPPAADYPLEAAAESRAAALAQLRQQWVRQYGEINEAVVAAKAQAQRVLDSTAQVVDDAHQVVNDAQQVVASAAAEMRQVQDVVTSLKKANLPEAARREAAATLQRLAVDARWEVRRQVAHAIGEIGDPALVPLLIAMLVDQLEVQTEALASLTIVVGTDVTLDKSDGPISNDERVRRWQLWYQEHPQQMTARR